MLVMIAECGVSNVKHYILYNEWQVLWVPGDVAQLRPAGDHKWCFKYVS